MKSLLAIGMCSALLLAALLPGAAAEPDRSATVWPQIFAGDTVDASLFSKAFLDQVPISMVSGIVGNMKRTLGKFASSSGPADDTGLTFERGSARGRIALDASGKIAGLLFTGIVCPDATKVLTDLLTSGIARDDAFSAGAPKDAGSQVTAVLRQMHAQAGDFVKLEALTGVYRATFQRASFIASIGLDPGGKIAAINFAPENTGKAASSRDDALQKLAQLPGSVSYVILEGRTERAALSADTPMSIGSAFKLSVLTALRAQVTAGKRRWSDVVTLRENAKSLPSGMLQDWPSGTHLTLETLATMMISRSDNTATDVLIHTLGREAIEPYGFGNTPMLTTRNMFALKSKAGAPLRERWRHGTTSDRRALLAQLDALPIPDILQAELQPADLDIEWRYSVRELCSLMNGVRDLPLMSVNPGVALPSDWKHVAYKGGSDAGVINMTTAVTTTSGKSYCVSATLNNKDAAVDENGFAVAYSAVLDQLKD